MFPVTQLDNLSAGDANSGKRLYFCYGFRPCGLDVRLGIGIGGAALTLGAHRACLLHPTVVLHLPPLPRFVVLA